MAKRFGVLRIVPLVLALAVALSACSFSTDTVATVGGERITRGELNALVTEANAELARTSSQSGMPPQTFTPAQLVNALVNRKLVELAARDAGIQLNSAEFETQMAVIRQDVGTNVQQARDSQLAGLATNAAGELRPLVNAYGGTGITDAELAAVARTEIERLISNATARGTQVQIGTATDSGRYIKDEAIILRNALAGRGVGLPPELLEPLISILNENVGSLLFTASNPDFVQAVLTDQGFTPGKLRQYMLVQLLKTQWAPAQVDAVVLQELRTDSQAKAQEAIQKGRAGTPFAELLATYQLPSMPPRANENQVPNSYVLAATPQLQTVFKTVAPGEFSEILPTADGSQFQVYRIVRIERRAPTTEEEEPLYQAWVSGLRTKYPVTIIDPALNTPGQ